LGAVASLPVELAVSPRELVGTLISPGELEQVERRPLSSHDVSGVVTGDSYQIPFRDTTKGLNRW